MAILPGPMAFSLALPDLTAGKAVLVVRFCDCRYLRGEDDFVCGTPQVLPDHRQHQSGVLFWPARTIGGASSWHRHCATPKSGVCRSACRRVVPKPAGVDEGRPLA
ncbi:MAG: hypothetical protein GDA36_10130 [Rhodobacteraceae bacterium]|nr:hypothetical protein [Paracoccaceae bacterium]